MYDDIRFENETGRNSWIEHETGSRIEWWMSRLDVAIRLVES